MSVRAPPAPYCNTGSRSQGGGLNRVAIGTVTGTLTDADRVALEDKLARFEQQTGTQLVDLMLIAVRHDDDVTRPGPVLHPVIDGDPTPTGGDDVEHDQPLRPGPEHRGNVCRRRRFVTPRLAELGAEEDRTVEPQPLECGVHRVALRRRFGQQIRHRGHGFPPAGTSRLWVVPLLTKEHI